MRLRTFTTIVAFCLVIPMAMARNYAAVPADLIFDTQTKRYGHLEYVGFYASAMRHWNFTESLAPFTNLTWIEVGSVDEAILRLEEAQDSGVKATLSVQQYIFDSEYQLKPDYLFKLSELQQKILSEGLLEDIAMVYPIDEPFLRASNSASVSRAQMYLNLLQINSEIEALFPGIPIGVLFNNKELRRSDFVIPASYTWIGFDCYENMFDCKSRPFTDYYGILLQHMSPEQSLMAVSQTWVRYRDYERGTFETKKIYEQRLERLAKNLKKRLRHHYELALSEPRMVAFIPFIWSMEPAPGQPLDSGFGADQFEENFEFGGEAFVDYLTKIARDIAEQDYVYPNLSSKQTEFSLLRPRDRYVGAILDVERNGRVSAWGLNRALSHKSLRMQLVVEHEGRDVYVSGLRRSFIYDDSLTIRQLPVLGVHGYRHRIPNAIVADLRGEDVVIKVRIYGDRATKSDFKELRKEVVL